jgi:predicted nuclease of predicted toxin-antitoxin system
VKPLDYPLFADENIHPEVVSALKASGKDIRSVHDEGLAGASDVALLRQAHAQGRVVIAHDSDFGRLAIQAGEPFTGIVYVRPGHISPFAVLDALRVLERPDIDAPVPFVAVVERRTDSVRVRLRR